MVGKALNYEVIKKKIQAIENDSYRGLFSTIYATGARVGEVVGGQKNKQIKGLLTENIRIEKVLVNDKMQEYMIITLETEKNRNKPIKEIPINCDREAWLVENIKKSWDQAQIIGTEKVFSYSCEYVGRLSRKIFGTRTHDLRHSRATHWTSIYGMPDFTLAKLLGHSSTQPTARYAHLRWKDATKYL